MPEPTPEQLHCQHYWIIETPDGHTSHGECKRCFLTKEFNNYDDNITKWGNDARKTEPDDESDTGGNQ